MQFWNGRAKDLAEQAKVPFFNPKEMGLSPELLLQKVNSNENYVKAFKKLYGGVTVENIVLTIAEFEKTLITPNSTFDRYLSGDQNAISAQAKKGYEDFKANGCISCHQGQNIGGNMFQKIGIFKEYPNQEDLGRYEITKREADKMVFKVPSLRNIAKTAPYFHDGSIPTLDACVQFMAYYQLGKFLDQETVDNIVAFLESLKSENLQLFLKHYKMIVKQISIMQDNSSIYENNSLMKELKQLNTFTQNAVEQSNLFKFLSL